LKSHLFNSLVAQVCVEYLLLSQLIKQGMLMPFKYNVMRSREYNEYLLSSGSRTSWKKR